MPDLADAAAHSNIILVVGAGDTKFVQIAERMTFQIEQHHVDRGSQLTFNKVVVPQCGHAVHIERPEAVLHLLGY